MPSIRLLYVFVGGTLKQNSVQRKIQCQIEGMRLHGIDARGVFYNGLGGPVGEGQYDSNIEKISIPKYEKRHKYFHPRYEDQYNFRWISHDLSSRSEGYDLIFFRHAGNGKEYERLLESLAQKIVLYIPSNTLKEKYWERRYAKDHSFISSLFSWSSHYLFWRDEKRLLKKTLSKLKAVVAFTPEFTRIIQSHSRKKINLIYNRDGADIDNVPARKLRPHDGAPLKLIFLKGSNQEQKWSGLDRLIRSIEAYPEIPIELFITGNANRHPGRYSREFVTLTGRLPDKELEQLIEEVDLGVSNLQNYLIDFDETTNLKSRDYYSRGLPFIQSNTMPDIEGTEGAQFYLHIPNDDSLIDMQAVYDFGMKMRNDPSHPIAMHRFAAEHLDWNITAGELSESLKKLV